MTDDKRFDGCVDASARTVRRYLFDNYGWFDRPKGRMSPPELDELMLSHSDLVEKGMSMGSHAHYVGDLIAERAGLVELML